MKIYNTPQIYELKSNKKSISIDEQNPVSSPIQQKSYELPNYKQVSFTAFRVDKGIDRFFLFNKERMPMTLYRYIDALVNPQRFTPLELQKMAFAKLANAKSAEDIKLNKFPEEELFSSLINPEQTRATKGILGCYRENLELLQAYEQGILENKENFTVYLLKKIFLEGKTIDEINKDFEKDVNKEFLALFNKKNPDSKKFIQPSTLKALGIQPPDFSYQQSLRYTREGYSDMMGEKISQKLQAFWTSLSPEERTVRAKKFIEKLENWWDGLSYQKKLEMLADEQAQLKMLESFKNTQKTNSKPATKTTKNAQNSERNIHTSVGSEKLSQDDLFIRWAKNNLKIFEESLSDSAKEELQLRRISNLTNRWLEMTPVERTVYIQKMKSGAEPIRYAMIDAWNNSKELILELSKFLKENQIFKPHDMLYSDKEFSELQSKLMTEFWEKNSNLAEKFGQQLKLSQQKVKDAISHGTFSALKKEIERDRSRRINDIAAIKIEQQKTPQKVVKQEQKPATSELKPEPAKLPVKTYKEEFIEAYNATGYGRLKCLPDSYRRDYPKAIADNSNEDLIKIWTKQLRGENITPEETEKFAKDIKVEPFEIAKMNRAFEAALADTVARITQDASAYELSSGDLKNIMCYFENGNNHVSLQVTKSGKTYNFEIKNKFNKLDKKQLNNLYEQYYKELSEDEIYRIIMNYFDITNVSNSQIEDLRKYISTFGQSIQLMFSDKSKYSVEVKNALNYKFLNRMPENLKESELHPLMKNIKDFKDEELLNKYKFLFGKKYHFLPQSFLNIYFDKIKLLFRMNDNLTFETLDVICRKRTSEKSFNRNIRLRNAFSKEDGASEILAMEQTLADILYKCTGDERVYDMSIEMLMDKLECFSIAKHFPTTIPLSTTTINQETFDLYAKKKPGFVTLKNTYENYLKEIKKYMAKIKGSKPENYNEILYILNPEEEKPMKDLYIGVRMAGFGLNTNVGKVNIITDSKISPK